jgi:membrane protein YqaA with SNARE-associated domain
MFRSLRNRIAALARHRQALRWLALVSFLESSCVPFSPDILIVPMTLGTPRRAFAIAGIATLASVAGGFLGYAIGHFLFHLIGEPILRFYDAQALFESFRALYHSWGLWIVLAGGFTPIPYKVVTIASGAVGLDPIVFALASAFSRGSRFFLEAWLLARYGDRLRQFVESRLLLAAAAVLLLALGLVIALRYL